MAKKTQKRSKIAPALLFAGLAGGIVTALRKRGVVDKVKDAAPDQVTQAVSDAADKASDLAQQAKDAAPDQVNQAVEQATGGDSASSDGGSESERRYAAPAEAGSQPPAEAGGLPSDDPHATVARNTVPDDLLTKPHDLPADVVMPDTSDDDPSVRAAEAAAAADAGAIGGNVDELAASEPGFPTDPERRPAIEGSGDPDEGTPEEIDRDLGGNRETQP